MIILLLILIDLILYSWVRYEYSLDKKRNDRCLALYSKVLIELNNQPNEFSYNLAEMFNFEQRQRIEEINFIINSFKEKLATIK
jgi:hypothetical protein